MKFPKSLGMILLAIWLILQGLLSLLSIDIPGSESVLAILALAAGILILVGR